MTSNCILKSKIPDSLLFLRLLEEKVVQFFFGCCFTFRGVQKCRWYVSYHWRQGAKPNIAVKSAQSDSCSNEKELQQAHLTVERTTSKPLESIEQHHKNRTSRSLHDNENIWKMKSSIKMNSAILKYAVNVLLNKSLQYVSDMIKKFDKIQFLQPHKDHQKVIIRFRF